MLCGVLLRLLLMPISAHCDLFSTAWRQSILVFNGEFKISHFSELLLTPYFYAIKPLLHHLPELLDMANRKNISVLQPGYEHFLQYPTAMRYIFLFKVPYLFIDFLIFIFGIKLFNKQKEKLLFSLIWTLNPLILYSVFMWGRYEVIPILLVFIVLFLIKKNNNKFALLILGFALISRLSLIFIIPFFIIYLSKNIKEYIVNVLLVVLPLVVWNQFRVLLGGSDAISNAVSSDYGRTMFHMQVGDGFTATSLFVIVYPILIYLFYQKKNKNYESLLGWSFAGLSAYFIFGYFNPHYPAWLSIFFLLLLPKKPKLIWSFFAFSLFYLLFIESYYGTVTTWSMFMPLNYDFFSSVAKMSDQSVFLNYNPVLFRVVVRSVFVLLLGYFSYIFIYDKSKKEN